ncbi:MAG TPA: SpoIIE family protein phosphatase, partial [Opitutaceae bacterium]|nr:SpoIIE family protein phosphatase [Opitutaceae bacterium]
MSEPTAPATASAAPSSVPKMRFGLRSKILLGLTIINIASTAIFSVNHYHDEKKLIYDGLKEKLTPAAYALSYILPDGYFDRAVRPDAITPQEYRANVDTLSRYCQSTGFVYLYSYTKVGDAFYCTSSNGTRDELAKNTFAHYWDPYPTAPQEIFEAWDKNEPVYHEVKDQYTHSYTLFLPLVTANGTRYLAGADLPISYVDTLLASSLEQSIFLGVGSFAVFFFISFILSTRLSRKIGRLAAYTREMAATNFQLKSDSPLRQQLAIMPGQSQDEVALLAASFLQMEDQLSVYLRDLTETTAAKERFQNELRIAGEIQASMLPHDFKAPGCNCQVDLYAAMKPAKEAGGDLYDFFYLDPDHLCFVIGDVSDKGMPAALFMAVAATVLRAHATADRIQTPEEILTQTNELLIRQNSMYQFITMFLGIVNVRTGAVVYSDGGHNRPYLRRVGKSAEMLPRGGGIALGVMPGASFKHHSLQIQPGDT